MLVQTLLNDKIKAINSILGNNLIGQKNCENEGSIVLELVVVGSGARDIPLFLPRSPLYLL